jgi:hypothetical protein
VVGYRRIVSQFLEDKLKLAGDFIFADKAIGVQYICMCNVEKPCGLPVNSSASYLTGI